MKVINYSIFFFVILLCFTCKKKTTIEVSVFNYALNECVADAKVVLVERKESGTFSSNSSCHEIASATTDANGKCSFDKEKLKTRGIYQYFLAISDAYGQAQSYPCGGKSSNFVEVGKEQTQTLNADIFDGYFRLQYNNLLNPSLPGDSLIVSLITIEYPNPKGGVVLGGGGVFGAFQFYDPNNPPPSYPQTYFTETSKTKGQRLKRTIRKHKLGLLTVKVDTVKVYPNETTTIIVDW